MDGLTPAPTSQAQIPAGGTEVDALRSRMEQLENHIVRLVDLVDTSGLVLKTSPAVHTTYPTPFSNHASASSSSNTPKTSTLDMTFLALDDLSRGYSPSASGTHRNESALRSDISHQGWPSIFLSNNLVPPSPRTTQAMFDIASAIPQQEIITILVDYHLSNFGMFWHFMQRNVFEAELAQFHQVRLAPNLIFVDPAWLALLIAVLRVSLQALIEDTDPALVLLVGDKPTLRKMDTSFADAFETAIFAARIFHKPQVRMLQALMILTSPQQLCRCVEASSDRGALWHDMAISLCKHLRLNTLDHNVPDDDLPTDPAFPPQLPHFTREWASRLTHSLLFVGQIAEAIETDRRESGVSRSIRLTASEVSTPPPRNFRDEELWSRDMSTSRTEPHPSFVLTEVSWQIHAFQVAHYWKIISDHIRDPSTMTMEVVRSIDTQLRQGDYELLSLRSSHQLSTFQDLILESFHGSYQQRVLRLHRNFFMRSYSDPTYDFSQSAALSAARAIIKGHKDVSERQIMFMAPGFPTLAFYSHHISAAVLLFIHACLKPSARQGIERELQVSMELFQQAQPPHSEDERPFWDTSVGRGRLFIEAMLKTLSSNPPTDIPSIESYMLNLNLRGANAPVPHSDAPIPSDDLQQVSLPALFNMFDGSAQDAQNGDVVSQDPALDWDSLFMGF
uniref:Transcription factor domain-containing protein n=1 Tax=Kwoniella bestiolae CBS 10118 TaxID=1296100 RepID=A0A1B9GCT8_9TREE|nr:hypothetical protein I302_00306 [Kwoniella bestiolae CBS 10118]OCF28817.1 hypothetical protein I302_00306 [Kwoniella bestiolae CBS 10118]